MRRRKNTRR